MIVTGARKKMPRYGETASNPATYAFGIANIPSAPPSTLKSGFWKSVLSVNGDPKHTQPYQQMSANGGNTPRT
jgi:hypothetical protein